LEEYTLAYSRLLDGARQNEDLLKDSLVRAGAEESKRAFARLEDLVAWLRNELDRSAEDLALDALADG
jgi:hypothetical protein